MSTDQDAAQDIHPFDLGYENPTDQDVADAVGVELRDLDAWLQVHVDFAKELARGRAKWGIDSSRDVAKQLLKSGTGYEGESLIRDKKTGAMTRVTEYIPPNFKAMEKFLEVHDGATYREPVVGGGGRGKRRGVPKIAIANANILIQQYGEAPVTAETLGITSSDG